MKTKISKELFEAIKNHALIMRLDDNSTYAYFPMVFELVDECVVVIHDAADKSKLPRFVKDCISSEFIQNGLEVNYNVPQAREGKWSIITNTTSMTTNLIYEDVEGRTDTYIDTTDLDSLLTLLLKISK